METIQLKNEFEYLLIQYIMQTSNNRSIDYIAKRLNALKKTFLIGENS